MPIAVRSTRSLRLVLGGLVLGLVTSTLGAVATGGPAAAWKPWGRAWAPDQPLGQGCHRYVYRYRVNAPTNEWQIMVKLTSPDGDAIAHDIWDGDYHPDAAKRRWTVCKPTTRYGRHKITMQVSWWEDDPAHTKHIGRVKPTYFRLYRPR